MGCHTGKKEQKYAPDAASAIKVGRFLLREEEVHAGEISLMAIDKIFDKNHYYFCH